MTRGRRALPGRIVAKQELLFINLDGPKANVFLRSADNPVAWVEYFSLKLVRYDRIVIPTGA
jgi:hypothetical protein